MPCHDGACCMSCRRLPCIRLPHWPCVSWRAMAGHAMPCCTSRLGMAWHGIVRHGVAWSGLHPVFSTCCAQTSCVRACLHMSCFMLYASWHGAFMQCPSQPMPMLPAGMLTSCHALTCLLTSAECTIAPLPHPLMCPGARPGHGRRRGGHAHLPRGGRPGHEQVRRACC